MKSDTRPDVAPARREPKTRRGRVTRDEILTAARKLLSERWVDEIPFTELAASAGVARASLLHAYPNWRYVLWNLLEWEIVLIGTSHSAAITLKRMRPKDRVYAMLVPLLDRAESTGHLYTNLRSVMFSWDTEVSGVVVFHASTKTTLSRDYLGDFARDRLNERYVIVEQLLGMRPDGPRYPYETHPSPIGECLVNFAFDLAAGSPTDFATFDIRRRTLRSVIDVVAAGIRKSKPTGVRKRRT